MEVIFTNYETTKTIKLSDKFKNKELYLLVRMERGQVIEMI